VKIKATDGSVIDLDDARKSAEIMRGYGIGNPYSVDMAIMVKYNVALLDALEAALSVLILDHDGSEFDEGRYVMSEEVRRAVGVVEESA
jgi:hypothetical protein